MILLGDITGEAPNLDALLKEYGMQRTEGYIADMERSYALWREHYNRLSTLVRHNEIDDTERLFQRARQALDNHDANESLLQLRDLRALLAHLPEMERPIYSNLI